MKKITKQAACFAVSALTTLSLAASVVLPVSNAFADGQYVLTFTADEGHTLANNGGHLVIDGGYTDLRDPQTTNEDNPGGVPIGTVSCNNNECTITVADGTPGLLSYNAGQNFTLFYSDNSRHNFGDTISSNKSFVVKDYVASQQDDGPQEPHFDGRAIVVWSCRFGICYHGFDDIPSFDDGNSAFYADYEVTSDNFVDPNEIFDVHAENKAWYLPDAFEAWMNDYRVAKGLAENAPIDWTQVRAEEIIGHPDMSQYEDQAINAHHCSKETMPRDEFEQCVNDYARDELHVVISRQLQPLPDEPYDNNAYVSYGDRNFKVVIYNEDYKGVSIGDLSDLNYYPAAWRNPFIRQDQYDISGTTKQNPTVINSVLLESTVNIMTLDYNAYGISKIEALDVPANAVTIRKVDEFNFKITFKSNFYDGVVFKVTDLNGGVQYFKIHRYTVDASVMHMEGGPTIYADFYYDKSLSFRNFNVLAKIVYKDGTFKNVTLENSGKIDDGLGNITNTLEYNEETDDPGRLIGKGLKRSNYRYKLGDARNISKIYINVEFKGSTKDNFAGAFAGSDQGIVIEVGE